MLPSAHDVETILNRGPASSINPTAIMKAHLSTSNRLGLISMMKSGLHSGNHNGIAVFSGGTAANFLVDVFDQIIAKTKCPLRYIIPISDNGGSSSELIRVFGGPSESSVPFFIGRHGSNRESQVSATLEVSTHPIQLPLGGIVGRTSMQRLMQVKAVSSA